jgi:putative membrane protein
MRSSLRWVANALAIFLALYLVDSVARGGFRVQAVWVAVVLALLLGLLNSLVRPLRRAHTKPSNALLSTALTVLVNALILQIFVWAGASLTARNFAWTLAVAAFVSLLAGTINHLVGFETGEKARPSGLRRTEAGPRRKRTERTQRTRT